MSELTVGIGALVVLGILLILRVPIGISLLSAGFLGWTVLRGFGPSLIMLADVPYSVAANYAFSVLPLFVIMGEFLFYAGAASASFEAAYAWIGRIPGGLGIATTAGCAAFSAMSGSSVAVTAAMGKVAIPEMMKFKYDRKLAAGCVAAAGTLGIMIPPSALFVIYGVITGESVGALLLAGIFPGLMLAALYMATVFILCRLNPKLAPLSPPRASWREKFNSIKKMWSLPLVVLIVMGGIYSGVMTPTEAGAGGAFVGFVALLISKNFNFTVLKSSLLETGRTVCMVMLIILGAFTLGPLLAYTRLPQEMANFIVGFHTAPVMILIGFCLMYIVLGTFLEGVAMVVITMPIVYPTLMGLGYDGVWFGVIICLMVEIGQMTPPVGMVCFTVASIAPDIPLEDVYKGIVPFLFAALVACALLIIFPQIALFLPRGLGHT